MSAVPKRNDPGFWLEGAGSRSTVLPKPAGWSPPAPEAALPREKPGRAAARPRSLTRPLFRRFERPLSILLIAAFFLGWSLVAYGTLSARVQARDSRLALQQLQGQVSGLKTQLEEARASLERVDAVEGRETIPIDPGDVIRIETPSAW